MTNTQKQAARVITCCVFVGAALLAAGIGYYAVLNQRGDPGDALTAVLAWCLRNQDEAYGMIGVVLVGLPGLAVPICVRSRGVLSRFGRSMVGLLAVTLVISVIANLALVPTADSPESQSIAALADATAKQLASVALTYLLVLLGLKLERPAG